MKSYKGLAELEEKWRNHQQALIYQKLYIQWKDSLLNEEKIKSINELNKNYQTEQKERNYLALLVILFLGVIVLIVILLKQKKVECPTDQ